MEHHISHVVLNVTNQCNFRCRMCFCDWNEHYMTKEIADKGIELALSRKTNQYEKIQVTFFGGEPLLNFPLIVYVVNKWKDKCNFTVTTNGSLLTPEIINFLKENNIKILLSIDGAKITQDYNRPFKDSDKSTFDVIYPKIPMILDAFPRTTFRSTIIPETVQYLFENYLFAKENGFQQYFCIPDAYSNWTPEAQKELMTQVSLMTIKIIKDIVNSEPTMIPKFILDGIVNHIKKVSDLEEKPVESIERCGLGITGIGIGATGTVVACQEHGTITDLSDDFIIGDVWNGISEEKHQKLLDKYLLERNQWYEENCFDCPSRLHCLSGICPSRQGFMYGHFNKVSPASCLWTKCKDLSANLIFKYFSHNYCQNFVTLLDFILEKKDMVLILEKKEVG